MTLVCDCLQQENMKKESLKNISSSASEQGSTLWE